MAPAESPNPRLQIALGAAQEVEVSRECSFPGRCVQGDQPTIRVWSRSAGSYKDAKIFALGVTAEGNTIFAVRYDSSYKVISLADLQEWNPGVTLTCNVEGQVIGLTVDSMEKAFRERVWGAVLDRRDAAEASRQAWCAWLKIPVNVESVRVPTHLQPEKLALLSGVSFSYAGNSLKITTPRCPDGVEVCRISDVCRVHVRYNDGRNTAHPSLNIEIHAVSENVHVNVSVLIYQDQVTFNRSEQRAL